ncbi:MAG TPA: hypothetical protein VMU64_06580 [Acidimicrobiales bacterium]|nr:hypothetical protein [Acidimicrobiales bacterium]
MPSETASPPKLELPEQAAPGAGALAVAFFEIRDGRITKITDFRCPSWPSSPGSQRSAVVPAIVAARGETAGQLLRTR